ncbi:MAG: MBL fold metallo-hydrolase [Pseudomonadales bacterium]
MSRKITVPLLILVLLAALIYVMRGSLAVSVMERAISKRMGADARDELPSGLNVGVCGAGGPLPDPQRSGACIVVMAGETMLLVDSGTNGARNLNRMGIPIGDVDAVLLTHFHSDHIDGLGETGTLRWVSQANTSPLPVIGPEGVEPVVAGFNLAYEQDTGYRQAHHGDIVAPLSGKGLVAKPFATPAVGEAQVVWDQDGLKVTAFSVVHDPVKPAVGYRFDYAGRSVVISGDTAQSSNLETFAKGADLLFHEALSRTLVGTMNKAAKETGNRIIEKVTADILDYHASPEEAAASANTAGVGHLVYYHIVPPLIMPGMDVVFLEGVDKMYDGPTTISRDGTLFSLPADSTDIKLIKKGL